MSKSNEITVTAVRVGTYRTLDKETGLPTKSRDRRKTITETKSIRFFVTGSFTDEDFHAKVLEIFSYKVSPDWTIYGFVPLVRLSDER
jgi:hypothetical protein